MSAFPGLAAGSAHASSFSRFAQRSLALRPAHLRGHRIVARLSEGFNHFVSSIVAPVLPAGAVRRVGFSPTGKRRLITAHANWRHSAAARNIPKPVIGRSAYYRWTFIRRRGDDGSADVHGRRRRWPSRGAVHLRGPATGPLATNRCLVPWEDGDWHGVLRQGLQELGYVEGRTAVIEWRWWEGKPERLRDAAAELVRLNPDVIVVGGSEATKAMKEATRSIPIVFIGPSYPVEEGLVESFARPGGNITGITVAQSDHVAKMLQLLAGCRPGTLRRRHHLEPGQSRNYVHPPGHGNGGPRPEAEGSAGGHGKRRGRGSCSGGHSPRPSRRVDRTPDPVPSANAERIGELAIRLRIPSITAQKR